MSDINGFIDDLQEVLDQKPENCCQNFGCKNDATYMVTERWGYDPEGLKYITTYKLCSECTDLKKKEGRDWGYNIVTEFLPGKKPTEVVKKRRGRPKNI